VVANEFGVYKNYVDPTSRNAWIHDVRSVLEKYNIGWAFWGYDDKGFGLFSYLSNTNTRTLNPTTAAALALNVTPKKMLK
jgi:endoglucanase